MASKIKGNPQAAGQPCRVLGYFGPDGNFVPTKDGAGLVGRLDVVGNLVFATIRKISQSADLSGTPSTSHSLHSDI